MDEAAQKRKAEGGGRWVRRGENKTKMGHKRRIKSTSEVKQARGKRTERSEERVSCGGGCDGFVGHVSPGCQGGPQSGGAWVEGG